MWRNVGALSVISRQKRLAPDQAPSACQAVRVRVLIPVQELGLTMGSHTSFASTMRAQNRMPDLRGRPLSFLFGYIRRHPAGHVTVLLSVLVAVACSVSTQYGLKYLIDIVSLGREAAGARVWQAFALLCGLVAADNLSWRVGGYAAHR